MDVFIGNLPAEARLLEIQDLLGGQSVHTRFERRMGRDCFDKDYHYFIVFTSSDNEGRALIDSLNGKIFDGCRITAREFIKRADCNAPARDWDRRERRFNRATSE